MPKLVLDKTLSAILLVLLSPLFAFVFVVMALDALVRARDRGPWLYRERRISRGREFDLLKFRTLRREVVAGIDPATSHARLHEADESNLTWAGRRLLKPRYLDELPQIWNVFRGDMSLVGPRPWPPSMVDEQVAKGFAYRNEFVAGWTGPAQVEKGVVESSGYAVLDVAYVEACRTRSAWRDRPRRPLAPQANGRRHGQGRGAALLSDVAGMQAERGTISPVRRFALRRTRWPVHTLVAVTAVLVLAQARAQPAPLLVEPPDVVRRRLASERRAVHGRQANGRPSVQSSARAAVTSPSRQAPRRSFGVTTNGHVDVFVRDLATRRTWRASVASSGAGERRPEREAVDQRRRVDRRVPVLGDRTSCRATRIARRTSSCATVTPARRRG